MVQVAWVVEAAVVATVDMEEEMVEGAAVVVTAALLVVATWED